MNSCRIKIGRWPVGSWLIIAIAAMTALLLTAHNVRSTTNVDLVLVLALDVSDSVDRREYELQTLGLAKAFRHPSVIKAVQGGPSRRIAVAVVQWSGFQDQFIAVPWQIVSDAGSAEAFAERLTKMPRQFPNGFTHIAGAIEFSTMLVRDAPFLAPRSVIDISGDGENNVNVPPHAARDAAIRAGVTVNGLAVVNESTGLAEYYRNNVIGGPGAFVIAARDYDDYAKAIRLKLLREINNVVS